MTVFWVDKIVKALKAYQVILPSDLTDIQTIYPNITLDEYYEAVAWGGLSVGMDGTSITNAWETLLENDPPKAAMYQAIQYYEQAGDPRAASKTKCN
ncbi:MAG: hypothetical protein JO301_03720 [Chitinophagaceae bacterium]|nr:hypothetical protein [Chitinophagaceae bacterium]